MTHHILDDQPSIEAFFDYSKDYEYVVLDLETNSVLERKALIWGIGIAFEGHEGFYIPIRTKDGNLFWSEEYVNSIYRRITDLCRTKKLMGWNLLYDTLVWEYNTAELLHSHIHIDGMLLKHTLDEERPHGLKETAVKYLGAGADKAQQALYENIKTNGGKVTKENMEMFKADTDVLGEYCAHDVMLTKRLVDLFLPRLSEEDLTELFFNEVMPLYKEVTIEMKREGFPVNVQYFKELLTKISKDISRLEDEIYLELTEHVLDFEKELLLKDLTITKRSELGKQMIACGIDIETAPLDTYIGLEMATAFYCKKHEVKRPFNLNSTKHLAWLFFEKLGVKPTEFTETGAPKLDAETLDELSGNFAICDKIVDFKKLQKLKSTYIEGILEREIDGRLYASFLQTGTTSGRFSCTGPNLQNLPRIKDEEANLSPLVLEYVNAIKAGFEAPKGYVIVNADYSQLEPCAFAGASGDSKLQEIFKKKWDLYCSIAIESEGLYEFSADKKAPNYLKNHRPELRQKYKAVALAVVYGAEAGRIGQLLDIPREEAQDIINKYLEAYPGLNDYMRHQNELACENGFVLTKFGRVRHLPVAKRLWKRFGHRLLDPLWAAKNGAKDLRRELKNQLNNAKNFPIQGLAAHIVNRAMINTNRRFKAENINGVIIASVHDELTCLVSETDAERAKEILKECMEKSTTIEVPLVAEPLIAKKWSDAK